MHIALILMKGASMYDGDLTGQTARGIGMQKTRLLHGYLPTPMQTVCVTRT
jgi:hypothetical protein